MTTNHRNTKLFNLVKSLSSAEKRHFKLMSGKNEVISKHLELFDLIQNSDHYKPEKYIRIVYGKSKTRKRSYSDLKGYLFKQILSSLRILHRQTSKSIEMKSTLQDIEILYGKMQFIACYELIRKAKKVCSKYELNHDLLELINWERKVSHTQENIQYFEDPFNESILDYEQNMSLISARNQAQTNFYKLFYAVRTEPLNPTNYVPSEYLQIKEEALKNLSKRNTLISELILNNRILSKYYYLTNRIQEFTTISLQLRGIYNQHQHFKELNTYDYLHLLSNLCFCFGIQRKQEQFEIHIKELNNVRTNTHLLSHKKHASYYSLKLVYLIDIGDYSEAEKLRLALVSKQSKFEHSPIIDTDNFLYYSFSIAFGNSDFSTSLKYLNLWSEYILSHDSREDMKRLSKILELVIHFELGNFILLESSIRSTYRYLSTRNKLGTFEKILLMFFRRILKQGASIALKSALILLQESLMDLKDKTPAEAIMLKYFHFDAWVESKLLDKSFAETVKIMYKHPNYNARN